MRIIPLTLHIICHELENGAHMGHVVAYPDVIAFGARREDVIRELTENVVLVLEEDGPGEIAERHAVSSPEVKSISLTLKPPKRQVGWQHDVRLTLNYVTWNVCGTRVAFVPALDVNVIATGSLSLSKLIDDHVRLILKRDNIDSRLENLVWLQRDIRVTLETVHIEPQLRTAKEFAMREFDQKATPVLPEVATNLNSMQSPTIVAMNATVEHLAETLTAIRPRSVLLVGPSGVGKTAAFIAAHQRRTTYGLKDFRFYTTSGARLVAGMTGFGAWQERCERVCAEAEPENVILHLGNLAELNMVGRSVGHDDGIAEFLVPYCQRGEIRAVAECTPEQASQLEESHPDLLAAFNRIDVTEPDDAQTLEILQETAAALQPRSDVTLTDDALAELLRLYHRYATYSTSPGRPLRFLKNLIHSAERHSQVAARDVTHSFAEETGLPLFLLDDAAPLDFDAMTLWFSRRVLGQESAIQVVTNLIATVKAGLARPDRPIASLLFVGPTGVGKTETAKALAEFLYHDPARMVRIDMSEYADNAAVDRLVGGADGGEGVLTSRVREQPFGVVLLDEFEKAHPRFFDLLLQVLGEGRLTDGAGRVADFRNSVIIMTSNLGTHVFNRGVIGMGRDDSAISEYDEQFFVAEIQKTVRPEFFNRIDRVVAFMPLDADSLKKVAQRELSLLSQREGLKYRDVQLSFDDGVLDEVVRQGYEPRYGARPIKRAIDRHVLAPLSDALNDYPADASIHTRLQVRGETISVDARRTAETNFRKNDTVLSVILQLQDLRRQIAQAFDCSKAQSIRNRIDRLEHEDRNRRKHGRKSTLPNVEDVERSRELASLQPLEGKIVQLHNDVAELEVMVLPDMFRGAAFDERSVRDETNLLTEDLRTWLEDIFLLGREFAGHAMLVFHAKNLANPIRMAQAVAQVAAAAGESCEFFHVCPIPEKELAAAKARHVKRMKQRLAVSELPEGTSVLQPVYWCQKINDQQLSLESLDEGRQAVAVVVKSRLAWCRYQGEAGLHEFKSLTGTEKVYIEALNTDVQDYERAALPLHDHKVLKGTVARRYDEKQHAIEDKSLKLTLQWPKKDFRIQLQEIVKQRFDNMLYRQIKE